MVGCVWLNIYRPPKTKTKKAAHTGMDKGRARFCGGWWWGWMKRKIDRRRPSKDPRHHSKKDSMPLINRGPPCFFVFHPLGRRLALSHRRRGAFGEATHAAKTSRRLAFFLWMHAFLQPAKAAPGCCPEAARLGCVVWLAQSWGSLAVGVDGWIGWHCMMAFRCIDLHASPDESSIDACSKPHPNQPATDASSTALGSRTMGEPAAPAARGAGAAAAEILAASSSSSQQQVSDLQRLQPPPPSAIGYRGHGTTILLGSMPSWCLIPFPLLCVHRTGAAMGNSPSRAATTTTTTTTAIPPTPAASPAATPCQQGPWARPLLLLPPSPTR